jgi:hypothetical protein
VIAVSNGCGVCGGIGRVLAFGRSVEPIAVPCPECAGLSITPASADDMRAYTVAEITEILLRHPALPPAAEVAPEPVERISEPVELVDEAAEAAV